MSHTAVSFNFTLIWSAHCLSLLGSSTSSQSLTDDPLASGDTAHLHRRCRLRSQPHFWLDPAFQRTGGDHKWLVIYLFPPLHSPFSDNRQTGYGNASTAVFRMPCMPGPLHRTGRATCPGSCWASVRHWGRTQNFLVSISTQKNTGVMNRYSLYDLVRVFSHTPVSQKTGGLAVD